MQTRGSAVMRVTKVDDFKKSTLLIDAKTLRDISDILRSDGRFKVLPSVLNDIAGNIEEAMRGEV